MNIVWRNLSSFKSAFGILALGLLVAWRVGGIEETYVVFILAILEISLSFENAVVNATVLRRLSVFWQRMFLTVGMLISVVGMRLLFPVVIIMFTAGLHFTDVIDLAINNPSEYALRLASAHPSIAAFGGIFFLMIFLDFVIDSAKEIHWIRVIELPLARVGHIKLLSVLGALVAVTVMAAWSRNDAHIVYISGLIGLSTYLVVRTVSWLFASFSAKNKRLPNGQLAGLGALGLFCYLELLDASFSFDGVIGAFAITGNVLIIMIGLAIGAMFIRELTVWIVRHDTLGELIYIEHGAYYAVGVLALMLGVSLRYDIPEFVIALVGVVFFGASLFSSLQARRS